MIFRGVDPFFEFRLFTADAITIVYRNIGKFMLKDFPVLKLEKSGVKRTPSVKRSRVHVTSELKNCNSTNST